MEKISILWADDEIDFLKPHIMFLEEKGFVLHTATSGDEALDLIKENYFDIVFLDENMPGLSGLETLSEIKTLSPNLPVVMITKSEDEEIMEEAIGSRISDYLIKPVNPHQILLCLKKNLEIKELQSRKTTSDYQQEFRNIGMSLSDAQGIDEWKNLYKTLVRWEMELSKASDGGMIDVLKMQKNEANLLFAKFIENNYSKWLNDVSDDKPTLSHTLLRDQVLPYVDESDENVFLFVIDNLRYDQWKIIQPLVEELFHVENDDVFFSILPTATQYARNAMFSGMMPSEIKKKYPEYWVDENEDETKNKYEKELLEEQLKRFGKQYKFSYNKILSLNAGRKLVDNFSNLMVNKLNVIVYNFVDMLSHARTDMEMIKELASDETAYRSLTLSWFEHSPLYEMMSIVAENKGTMIITTDHGSIRVDNPVKIVGDKNTNTNLRYKTGKNLDYNKKNVFEVKNPEDIYLPKMNISSSFVFCKQGDFFAYPNNYNYYVSYYNDTFQHGGVSLEEVLIPVIRLKAK